MKRYVLILLCMLLLLPYSTGCKNRQVTSLIDPSTKGSPLTADDTSSDTLNDSLSSSETKIDSSLSDSPAEESSLDNTGSTTSDSDPDASDNTDSSSVSALPGKDNVNPDQSETTTSTPSSDTTTNSGSTTTTQDPVVIAESENLDDVDERAMILNELDALLNDVLTSLDELDENPITEDLTNIGGQ